MKLYYSSTSPFVRKVNVFAIEAGLESKIEWIKINPWLAETELTEKNPLSKIPTLILDDGRVIYDSHIICEYLDTRHSGEKLFPVQEELRWASLCLHTLANGMLDAGILRLMESKRNPEEQSADWDKLQKLSIERGLDFLDRTVSNWPDILDIGVITVACLLGWLDFRYSAENWRENRSNLNAWYEGFSKRPSMTRTEPYE